MADDDQKRAKKELQKRGKQIIAKKFGGVPSLEVTDEQLASLKKSKDQDAVKALQEHDRKKLRKQRDNNDSGGDDDGGGGGDDDAHRCGCEPAACCCFVVLAVVLVLLHVHHRRWALAL